MRYLLLGGTGFIGSCLAKKLALEGEVVITGRRPRIDMVMPNLRYQQLDFTKCGNFAKYMKDVDVVVHLVSTIVPSEETDLMMMEVEENVGPTLALLKEASRLGKKIVFVSSGGAVYGECKMSNRECDNTNPICNYGIIKLMIEKYLALYHDYYGLDYRIVRPSNPYSEVVYHEKKQGIIPIIIDNIINEKEMNIYGEGQIRDYIHIDDFVDGMKAVLDYRGDERIFNIGTGMGYSISEVVGMIEKKMKGQLRIKQCGARKCDVSRNVLDISLIERETGWRPKISLSEGISRVVESRLKDMV